MGRLEERIVVLERKVSKMERYEGVEDRRLLPCPFCGSQSSLRVSGGQGSCSVLCSFADTGCGCSSGWRQNVCDAISAWNRRA